MKFLSSLKEVFIPTPSNSYHPAATSRSALALYTALLLIFNLIYPVLFPNTAGVYASSISQGTLVTYANQERSALGLSELTINPRLTAAATAKGNDMLAKDYWDHFGPNGETPWQFIIAAGYSYVYAGENLAKGFSTSEGTHQAWMASPTHRTNIVNPNYTEVGIAVLSGTLQGEQVILVVQMFGSTAVVAPDPIPDDAAGADQNVEILDEQPAPLPKIEIGEIKSISISRPEQDELLNDPTIDIQGSVEGYESNIGSYSVTVERGGEEVAGGRFEASDWQVNKQSDWEEGLQELRVYVEEFPEAATDIQFTVDSTPPAVSLDSVTAINNIDEWEITLIVEEADLTVQVILGSEIYEIESPEDGVYVGAIEDTLLRSSDAPIILSVSDKIGNSTELDISELFEEDVELVPVSNEFLGISLGGISVNGLDTRGAVNLLFVGAVAVLLGYQAYRYRKEKLDFHSTGTLMAFVLMTLVLLAGLFIDLSGGIL